MEKYLIVGLGSIGKRHLQNLRRLRPTAEIAVLRLHSKVTASDVPEGANLQFTRLSEALAFAPNAAIIATPASSHIELGCALAAAGTALFMEKPIAHTTDGLSTLLEKCAVSDLPLMVGYNLRFLPSLKECKHLIDSGAIGKVLAVRAEVGQYLPDWRPNTRYQDSVSAQQSLGGGALLELSHELDYLCWIFGMPQRVSACGGKYSTLEIDVEDMVSVTLEYTMPARLVEIHLDFLQRTPVRTCKFIGELGTLLWNGISNTIELFHVNEQSWRTDIENQKIERNQMYMDELEYFLNCVYAKKNVLGKEVCDGMQARNVLMLVEAAKKSIRSGYSVPIYQESV